MQGRPWSRLKEKLAGSSSTRGHYTEGGQGTAWGHLFVEKSENPGSNIDAVLPSPALLVKRAHCAFSTPQGGESTLHLMVGSEELTSV